MTCRGAQSGSSMCNCYPTRPMESDPDRERTSYHQRPDVLGVRFHITSILLSVQSSYRTLRTSRHGNKLSGMLWITCWSPQRKCVSTATDRHDLSKPKWKHLRMGSLTTTAGSFRLAVGPGGSIIYQFLESPYGREHLAQDSLRKKRTASAMSTMQRSPTDHDRTQPTMDLGTASQSRADRPRSRQVPEDGPEGKPQQASCYRECRHTVE